MFYKEPLEILRDTTFNNLEGTRCFVDRGGDVNMRGRGYGIDEGSTPLHVIVRNQRGGPTPEIIKYLVSVGADVNARDTLGKTPIFHADLDQNIIEALIDSGADIEVENNNGNTALVDALLGYHFYHAEILISHGATIGNLLEADDITIRDILLGAFRRHFKIVEYLISKGLKITNKNGGMYLLEIAIECDRLDFAENLIRDGIKYDKLIEEYEDYEIKEEREVLEDVILKAFDVRCKFIHNS